MSLLQFLLDIGLGLVLGCLGGLFGLWLPLFAYIASLGAVLPNAAASADRNSALV